MLDRDALAQLKGLKTQIEAEKERIEAVLRGTPARYGFARTDDGREVFVPPDEMLKAFPGDRVRVCIRPGKDKRPIAEIEGLVESSIGEFTGRCVSKGKAMFVEPDIAGVNRWLFLPPQTRNGVKAGDYLRCALQRHPIRDGKPQAKVLGTIGAADDPGIENAYTMAKYGLQSEWSDSDKEHLEKLVGAMTPETDSHREDFSNLAFVTIDAARTQDIDDALYAEVTNDGWLLYVAIADPTAYINADSPLRATVAERASSAYFHGAVVPMLPESIAQQRCALAENELRPALVCRVAIAEDGSVGEYRFFEATIRSRAKLSYFAVDRYLGGQDESLICHATPLEALYQVSRALRGRREAQELVMEDRQEFRWLLDDRGHIENIEPCEKLSSQRLVEECMVATNRCAAMFLAEAGANGPFVVHDGFRRDRLKDRAKFLELYVPDSESLDPDSLEGYRDLLRQLASSEHELPLRSMVNRLLTRARLSKKPGAHMGMSLPLYTNCTSPLRKYLDFLVHLQIKATLRGETGTICEQPELDSLSQKLQKLRQISNEAERWLTLEYLQRLAKSTSGPWAAQVSHMGNNGFSVRLDDSGLEGYVDLRKAGEKFHFDKWTATLKSKTRQFRVNTPVHVTLLGSDEETAHLPLFKLDPNSGRKLEVVAKPSEATDN
ncbi:VacB/RNase II family 3'-5' exoribonuclease [Congregibacter brevis]|uniref:exoribonuclease II n=1 Tax=Congregibacter brevis TaxID=3081201 RepID=A0ABZ0ICT1_9GAMM|nr:VacB/RNase II family 3'-5' exoribonuclease [Congregibacter sp. IMCC45268]